MRKKNMFFLSKHLPTEAHTNLFSTLFEFVLTVFFVLRFFFSFVCSSWNCWLVHSNRLDIKIIDSNYFRLFTQNVLMRDEWMSGLNRICLEHTFCSLILVFSFFGEVMWWMSGCHSTEQHMKYLQCISRSCSYSINAYPRGFDVSIFWTTTIFLIGP